MEKDDAPSRGLRAARRRLRRARSRASRARHRVEARARTRPARRLVGTAGRLTRALIDGVRAAPVLERAAGLVLIFVLAMIVAFATENVGPRRGSWDEQPEAAQWGADRQTAVRDYRTFVGGGHRDVLAALESDGTWEHFAGVLDAAQWATVRVRVHYNQRGNRFSTDHGSGFVLRGGRHVVTAAHVVDVLDDRDDCEVRVALADGRLLPARVLVRATRAEIDDENDWAVLELGDDAGPGLCVASPRGDTPVMALGFPEEIGISADGRVVADAMGKGYPLRPTALLGELEGSAEFTEAELVVSVGAIPLGGMSGGPVLDQRGDVVAIETGVRSWRKAGGEVRWVAVVHPTEALRAWLREHVPDALTE